MRFDWVHPTPDIWCLFLGAEPLAAVWRSTGPYTAGRWIWRCGSLFGLEDNPYAARARAERAARCRVEGEWFSPDDPDGGEPMAVSVAG